MGICELHMNAYFCSCLLDKIAVMLGVYVSFEIESFI